MTADIRCSIEPTQPSSSTSSSSSSSVQELKDKLTQLQQRRQLLTSTRQEQAALKARLQEHCHQLQHEHDLKQSDALAWKLRHQKASAVLADESPRWNAVNDAFFIWHQGPFATINNIRLGAEAVVTAPNHNHNSAVAATTARAGEEDASTSVATTAFGVMAATVSLPGRYLGFSSAAATEHRLPNNSNNNAAINNNVSGSTSSSSDAINSNKNSNQSHSPNTTTIRVPWTEINSALGQIVLLLKLLEETPRSGISFPRHVLIPQGSTSKIGLRQPNAITGWGVATTATEVPIVAMYHLCSDDSFSLFGKRNFNLALRALTECLAIAANAIHSRDRTIVMPFPMQVEHDNPTAPCTIGGLPVQYGTSSPTDGVTWTRVMKYMLTNVKWCVAYTTKHVDQ